MDQSEKGTYGHLGGNAGKEAEMQRWQNIRDLTKTKSYWEIYEEMPDLAIKYAKALQDAAKHYKELRKEIACKEVFMEMTSEYQWDRPWHVATLNHIEANLTKWIARVVLWIYDSKGGCGKTTFAEYLENKYPNKVQYLEPAKHQDLARLIDEDKQIFIIDVQKAGSDNIPYTLLESIKNGRVVSTKYEPEQKRIIRPIVIILSNSLPNYGELIRDRLQVFNVEDNEFVPY